MRIFLFETILVCFMERSYLEIQRQHLEKLRDVTKERIRRFFENNLRQAIFKDKLFAIVLIQGAALHFLDLTNGIKDFDILLIFRESNAVSNNSVKHIFVRRLTCDSSMPEFGRYPRDNPNKFPNRHVDIFLREIENNYLAGNDILQGLKNYFKNKQSTSFDHWRAKPVIGIWPEEILEKIIWNPIKT
jgi:hypothetical protein